MCTSERENISWRMLVEEYSQGYLTIQEVRAGLEEISYDMTEDELEEAEDRLDELEVEEHMKAMVFSDGVPFGEEEAMSEYFSDYWTATD